ncbi:MAG: Asp-tRNA(Asn)/Glu-tRNA(Gln) amidotransferase subunit GatC [Holosporaceae bacterium]|jgi:aspartyl-tRNA(Asn)/glutamyl-tRNA(Gln) amidotransferase subunit C|nr:Asp-tRNA(Asn)/Glu-tRNA(Gln) amidotransferase subunit GatC [Holosporaceae bacterium]
MSVSREDVKKVAHLARIGVSDSEIDGILRDLDNILGFIEQLNSVDCSGANDGIQIVSSNILERVDVAEPCDVSAIMSNAPEKESNMFAVPKVVG